MTIRQLQPKDVFSAKALWQEIFHDTEPFANFFFSRRYTPTLSFGVFDGDLLVSMALGRLVRVSDPSVTAVLISGVSTLPEYRRQGLMHETMRRTLLNADARGIPLALLSPVSPDLYRPFGFFPITFAIEASECAAASDAVETGSDPDAILPIYRAAMKAHPLMLQRTPRDMRLALDEYAADGGVTLLLKDRSGYLCYLPAEGGIEVTECLALHTDGYRTLLGAAAAHAGVPLASALLPADCGLAGTVVRPLHARPIKALPALTALQNDRRAFLIERY